MIQYNIRNIVTNSIGVGMNIPALDSQQQSISDDQELAKALAGVTQEAEDLSQGSDSTPQVTAASPTDDDISSAAATQNNASDDAGVSPDPMQPLMGTTAAADSTIVDPGLASVKQAALSELRPLVGKLNVSPEEKFNTYLLLIRSTDDRDLIAPAHEAASAITDEAKKAQALLDIIKEIDYLSSPKQ